MANSYLSRTFSGSPTMTTFTISFWMKRSGIGSTQRIMSSQVDGSNSSTIYITSSDSIVLYSDVSNSNKVDITTNRKFRDVNAWYHILYQVNTTLATANDRVKLWVNGVEETDLTRSQAQVQNEEHFFLKSTATHEIGRRPVNNDQHFDGYLSHVCIVQGSVVAPTSFGETDSTSGIWKFKAPSGVSFGTNGFHLKFENSGALGTDSSGNSQTWTVNGNLKQALDTPSNVHATFNPLDNFYASATFSNGNNTVVTNAGAYATTLSTLGMSSGKWYCEIKATNIYNGYARFGISGSKASGNGFGNEADEYVFMANSGQKRNNNTTSSYSGVSWNSGDIIGIAVDLDNNYIYFSRNGSWINSGNPASGASGTNAAFSLGTPSTGFYHFGVNDADAGGGSANTYDANFGNGFFGTTAITSAGSNGNGSLFEYDVPSGYYALNTKNINTYG